MKEFSKRQLLINYLLGICTSGEQEEVERWLAEDESNVQILQEVAKELTSEQLFSSEDKDQIKENIFSGSSSDKTQGKATTSNSVKLKYLPKQATAKGSFYKRAGFWIKAAAVILIAITASFGAYRYSSNYNTKEKPVWHHLTLPYGKTASLQLSDGSVIKLKGGSTLRYPTKFAEAKRVVYLKGEAFFSVEHGEDWPFVVHTGDITTYDLGTSFNIKAYENDDKIQVVVAEGKVAITNGASSSFSSLKKQDPIILTKNQWATFQKGTQAVERGEGNIWEKIAWKDGVLIFDNELFSHVATELERWYGIQIIIKDEDLAQMRVKGSYDNVSLHHVLESIHFILGAEYTIKDDVVTFRLPSNESNNIK